MRNDGTAAEAIFDAHWAKKGKAAFCYKFVDAKALHGMNKRRTASGTRPSDRLVSYNGETFYAEVKSTVNPARFDFNLIKPSQHGYAKMITAAGGDYRVYVLNLNSGRWYCVPYQNIAQHDAKSFGWEELEQFECTM